jgi:hypothetical protein
MYSHLFFRLKPWRGGCAHHSVKAATSPTSSEERGGCLSILMNSHLFHFVPPLSRLKPWRGGCGHHSGRHEVEVAVHLNGQTAMRKEVRSEKRWLTLTSMNDSHLFSHG